MLEQADIKLKGLNADKLRAEYQALETQKKELTATYKSCEKEVWDLKRKYKYIQELKKILSDHEIPYPEEYEIE